MADSLGFRQKGTDISRGFQSEATDADPSEESGFAANIGVPVWRQFVNNEGFQKAFKGAIDAEKSYQRQMASENRSSSSGGSWKGVDGKVSRLNRGIPEEHDAESLLDHPELGGIARKSVWDRDINDAKRESEDADLRIKDPSFHARGLAKKDREAIEAEGSMLAETDPRHIELKAKLVADTEYQAEKSALAQKSWDAKARANQIESTDPDSWLAQRNQPTAQEQRAQTVATAQAQRSEVDMVEESAARRDAELQAKLAAGMPGPEAVAAQAERAEIANARGLAAQKRVEAEAPIKAVQGEAEKEKAYWEKAGAPNADGKTPPKDFFNVGDTVSGIWDAVKGLGTSAPAAFYQLVEGMERPDQYSESAKKAFAEADAFNKEMQAKTDANQAAGTSSSVGESFREAGGSLGFSLGSMAAAIPASMAGAKGGAIAGGAIGGAIGAPAAGVGAAPGAAIGASIGGTIGGVTAGMAASGTAAYRMAGASFLNESWQQLQAESQKKSGRPMNEAEMQSAYDALIPIAQNTALWEAGPEAVGNAVTMGAGQIIFGLGKGLAKKFAGSIGAKVVAGSGSLATELATETMTQVEQGADQKKAQAIAQGQDPNAIKANWSAGGVVDAFKEVAPQTLALMGLMGGAGGALKLASKALPSGTPADPVEEKSRIDTALQAIDPEAPVATSDEVARAAMFTSANMGVEGVADGVLVERELVGVETADAETLAQAQAALNEAQTTGGDVKAAEALVAQARVATGRAPLTRAVLKIAAGLPMDNLTSAELEAVGYKAGEGSFTEMSPKEREAAGVPAQMLVPGHNNAPILTDAALAQVEAASPRARARITMDEAQARAKALSTPATPAATPGTPQFEVEFSSGKKITVSAATEAEARKAAAGHPDASYMDRVMSATAIPAAAPAAAPAAKPAAVPAATPPMDQRQAKSLRTQAASQVLQPGDLLIDRKTGETVVVESVDNNFGKFVVTRNGVREVASNMAHPFEWDGFTQKPAAAPVAIESPALTRAITHAKARIAELKAGSKQLADAIVDNGARGEMQGGKINVNPDLIIQEALDAGLTEEQAIVRFNTVLDEELSHLGQTRSAVTIWKEQGSPGDFNVWFEEHYGNTIWQGEFVAKGKAEVVRGLYTGTTAADRKAWDAMDAAGKAASAAMPQYSGLAAWDVMPDANKALEGIRVMKQRWSGKSATEAARLWTDISQTLYHELKVLLVELKRLVRKGNLSPALQQEIEYLDAALKQFAPRNPKADPKKPASSKKGDGTGKPPGSGGGTGGNGGVEPTGGNGAGAALVEGQQVVVTKDGVRYEGIVSSYNGVVVNPKNGGFNLIIEGRPKKAFFLDQVTIEVVATPPAAVAPEPSAKPATSADGVTAESIEADYQSALRLADSWAKTDSVRAEQMRKAAGMQKAAAMRKLTGNLTAKEQQAKDAYEASNYTGKPVSVDGRNGNVTGVNFGRVSVKFEDGTKSSFAPDQINPPVAAAPTGQSDPEAAPESFAQKEYKKRKTALNKAIKAGQWQQVVDLATADLAYFEETGFPDDWSNWERAKEDAQQNINPRSYVEPIAKPLTPLETLQDNVTGAIGRGEKEAVVEIPATPAKPALTPGEQALKDAFSDMVDGLDSAPLVPDDFYRSKGIPREKRTTFMNVADTLYDEGVRTPEALAIALEKAGNGKLRPYSAAMWSMLKANYPELSDFSDWASSYSEIDKTSPNGNLSSNENTAPPTSTDSDSPQAGEGLESGTGRPPVDSESGGKDPSGGAPGVLPENGKGAGTGGNSGTVGGNAPRPGSESETGAEGGVGDDTERGGEPSADGSDSVEPGDGNGVVGTEPRAGYRLTNPESIIGAGGPKARFARNKLALETYDTVLSENRDPTPAEQNILAAYIGWGSFGQELFQGTWERPNPKDNFRTESEWLRDHLGQKGWESIRDSILNAHYTDPPHVQALWRIVEHLGFKGGRILEPSMGIGTFFGLMPDIIRSKSSLTGIELDSVVGGMAKMLYPDANIRIMGYEKSATADGFYDLVIGNWPFAREGPSDPRYNSLGLSLHDYFFVKALDQTRAGGLVIGITSNGTMDKKGQNTRRQLARRAELVAAFRFPSGAFDNYAGTKVVTDVLILKKRATPSADIENDGWINTQLRGSGERTFNANEYWNANPQNVLGEMTWGHGTTSGKPGMIVNRQDGYAEALARIEQSLPKDILTESTRKDDAPAFQNKNASAGQNSVVWNEGDVSTPEGFYIVRGEQLERLDSVFKWRVADKKVTEKRTDELKQLLGLRDSVQKLLDAQREGSSETETIRADAKAKYDAYVKTHKTISKSFMVDALTKAEDPMSRIMENLERKEGKGMVPRDILLKDIMRRPVTDAKGSIEDAFAIQRNQSTTLSIDTIAELSGMPASEVIDKLKALDQIYQTPTGEWESREEYLGGNVRRKLNEAKDALSQGLDMERNVEALEKIQPKDVPYFEIEVQMGASWIPRTNYLQFATHLLGGDLENIEKDFNLTKVQSGWNFKVNNARLEDGTGGTATWGTRRLSFSKIFGAAMNGTTVKVWDTDSDGVKHLNDAETQLANTKVDGIREELASWLWSDPARAGQLGVDYNNVKNSEVVPNRSGSHLRFEGLSLTLGTSEFDFRQHQKDAVWRFIMDGRGVGAHEVGTGKTFTMAGLAVEGRRLGVFRKTLLFAHNSNAESVYKDFQAAYPGGKFLFINSLNPEVRENAMRQIATDEWDAVIVTHSLIDRFALREETLMQIAKKEITQLESEIADELESLGQTITDEELNDDKAFRKKMAYVKDSHTAKDLVKSRNRIIKRIKDKAAKAHGDKAVFFEDLGIDAIMVDEAHIFKKISLATRKQVKGLNKDESERGWMLGALTDTVKAKNNGKGVFLFTGTPLTNNLNEAYNMMKFVMDDAMADVGINGFDDWFNDFAASVTDTEWTTGGTLEPVTRLLSFVNVPELARLAGRYFDVVQAKNMPEFVARETTEGKSPDAIGRPFKTIRSVTAEMTERQKRHKESVKERYEAFQRLDGKSKRLAMLNGVDTPIQLESEGTKAALDIRLLFMGAEDDPNSKVNMMLKNAFEHYIEDDQSTQMIFMEQGFNDYTDSMVAVKNDAGETVKDAEGKTVKQKRRRPKFNLVRDMVEKLVAQGVRPEEIAVFSNMSLDTIASRPDDILRKVIRPRGKTITKEDISALMREGKIRFAIGSTQTMGTGVNAQTQMRAMHHLDAPWTPGEFEQRNGRGHRQGNQWNTVFEYRYYTEGSHDVRRWQVLLNKVKFISRFTEMLVNAGGSDLRVLTGDGADLGETGENVADFEQSLSTAAGDPRIMIRAKLKTDVDKLSRKRDSHFQAIARAREDIKQLRERKERDKDQIARSEEMLQVIAEAREKPFEVKIDGKTFTERAEAETYLAAYPSLTQADNNKAVIDYHGIQVIHEWSPSSWASSSVFYAKIPVKGGKFEKVALGKLSIASMENNLRGQARALNNLKESYNTIDASIASLQAMTERPFTRMDELAAKEKAFQQIEAEINRAPHSPPSWLRQGAPVGSLVYLADGKAYDVAAHRWDENGWWVLVEDKNGMRPVDYRKVFDESKHEMFEEIPFVPPVKVKEYGYARPTDLANSAPENHTRIDETDERGRYGVIYYSRPLSATQIRSFNLTAVPERERVNPPAEPETTDRVGTVPTFGGKLFESKSQKGPQYLRLTRQLAGLRKAMERYEEKYPDGNSAGNEKLGFDQEAAQEARENLEREEGETSEEFSDRFDAVNKREDDLNAIDSFRVRLESKIESIEKELAELESVRAKADLSTPYGYTKGPFGTLYSAPLRADSPEWKAMSKEQRREYIANRKDGNPDFDARSANTQRAGTVNTYRKAAEGMIPKGHKVVDYSAGLGLGADVMRSLGFSVTTMEPFPEKWASKTPVDYTEQGKVPSSSADTVTNFSALNVVPLNIRNGIVSDIARIVKPGGQAIFSARTLQNVQSAANKRPADEPGSFWVKNQGEENFQKGFSSLELVAYLQKQLGNQWTVAPSTKLNGAVAVATKNNPPQTAANIIALAKELDPAAFKAAVEDARAYIKRRKADGVALSPVLMGDQITLAAQGVLVKYADNPRALRMLDGYGEDQFSGLNAAPLRADALPKIVRVVINNLVTPKVKVSGQSLRDALMAVPKRSFYHPFATELAKLPLNALTFQKLVTLRRFPVRMGWQKPGRPRAYYSIGSGFVSSDSDAKMEAAVLVHETLHAITSREISLHLGGSETSQEAITVYREALEDDAVPVPMKDLIRLFFHTVEKTGNGEHLQNVEGNVTFDNPDNTVKADMEYGFGNLHEFVAEAFSNSEFQAILKKLPYPKLTRSGETQSSWDALVDAIMRLVQNVKTALTSEKFDSNVLEQTLRAALDLAEINDLRYPGKEDQFPSLRSATLPKANSFPRGVPQAFTEEARDHQQASGRNLTHERAGFGSAANREQLDVVTAYYDTINDIQTNADNLAEARRMLVNNPADIDAKLAGAATDKTFQLTPADHVAMQLRINQLTEQAGNNEALQAENGARMLAYRIMRGDVGRLLQIGWDRDLKPAERALAALTEAIYMPSDKIQKAIASLPLSERKAAITKAANARVASVTAELAKINLKLSDITKENDKLKLANSKLMKDVQKARPKIQQNVLKMIQQGASLGDIKRRLNVSAEEAQKINKDAREDLRAKIAPMVAAGMSMEEIVKQLNSLQSAPLGAGKQLTPEQIAAEVERILTIGFGLPEEVRAKNIKPKKVAKVKPVNVMEADWSRPDFKDNMDSVTFDTKDRSNIMQRVEIIRGLAGAIGKIGSLDAGQQVKAMAAVAEINAILAKYGTDVKDIFESSQSVESYGFDLNDINHVGAVARMISTMDADFVDKATELVYANMLSGLQTMLVNATAIIPATWEVTVGRAYDLAVNAIVKDPMSAQLGESKYILKALKPAWLRAMSNFKAAFISQHPMFDRDVLAHEIDWDKILGGGGYRINGSISGKKGDIIRIPMRLLAATDDFNRTLMACVEVGTFAFRIAKARGMKPGTPEFAAFLKSEVNTPGSPSYLLAANKASRAIFSNPLPSQQDPTTGKKIEVKDLGDVVGYAAASLNKFAAQEHDNIFAKAALAIVRVSFFPFQRTPFNILRKGVRHTLNPFSVFDILLGTYQNSRKDNLDGTKSWKWNANGRNAELVERVGQQLQGATLMLILAAMGAGEGDDDDQDKPFIITGSSPFTPRGRAERETQMRSGVGPYRISFRKDGKERFGISYGRFEPIATTLAATIDLMKSVKRSNRAGGDSSQAAAAALGGFAAQAQDKSFMKGISDLISLGTNILAEPDVKDNRKFQQFLASRFSMVFPNLIKQPIREMDANFRERSDSFMQEVLYQVAPAGQKNAKRDPYGDEVTKTGNAAGRIIDMTEMGTDTVNPVDAMLLRFRDKNPGKAWFPSSITTAEFVNKRTGKPQKMTGDQLATFRELSGKLTKALLKTQFINYNNPTEVDVKKVKSAYEQAKSKTKDALAFRFSK
jgi:N12 class adenine-specific DNA methylase